MSELDKPALEFPCDFPMSVIGINSEEFPLSVMEILQKHVPGMDKNAYSVRPSRDQRYLSVKVKFVAESRSQLDNLYQELTSQENILWVL